MNGLLRGAVKLLKKCIRGAVGKKQHPTHTPTRSASCICFRGVGTSTIMNTVLRMGGRSWLQSLSSMRCRHSIVSRASIRCSSAAAKGAAHPDRQQNTNAHSRRSAAVPALFATQKSEASTSESGSNAGFGEGEALLKQLTLQLPQFCCGCGIRLQRIQPEEPG